MIILYFLLAQLFFRSLPADCYINIVGFGSSYRKLWPLSIKYSKKSLQEGTAHISCLYISYCLLWHNKYMIFIAMGADLGGTEILQPLQDILQAPTIPGYARQVFVLTDGEVSNTQQVIDCVRAYQNTNRVFALGLGDGASHELVEGIGIFMQFSIRVDL